MMSWAQVGQADVANGNQDPVVSLSLLKQSVLISSTGKALVSVFERRLCVKPLLAITYPTTTIITDKSNPMQSSH
jgi:hypothetical protein